MIFVFVVPIVEVFLAPVDFLFEVLQMAHVLKMPLHVGRQDG